MKRTFDLVMSVLLIALFSPFLLLSALLVKAGSSGPLFYRGVRIGRQSRPFRIFKFRTMVVDAEAGGTATGARDPRVTGAGQFLRRTKLDELPQLFNVLLGDMSFVGPRPEVEEHTSVYSAEEREALSVRPGITDLSSVYFYRLNDLLGTDDPNAVFIAKYRTVKNGLRVEYVRHRSAWLDLSILVATATCVLTGGRLVIRLSPRIRPVAR